METLDNITRQPQKYDYRKLAVQYGLVTGAVSFALMLGAYIIGFDIQMPNAELFPKMLVTGIAFLISVSLLVMVMTKVRDEHQGGFLTMREAIGISIWLSLGSSLVMIVYALIMKYLINPNFMEEMRVASFETWEKQGLSEDKMEQYWDMTKIILTEPVSSIFALVFGVIGGVILGAIVGYFQKRDKYNR